jgi:hypothetical protein
MAILHALQYVEKRRRWGDKVKFARNIRSDNVPVLTLEFHQYLRALDATWR